MDALSEKKAEWRKRTPRFVAAVSVCTAAVVWLSGCAPNLHTNPVTPRHLVPDVAVTPDRLSTNEASLAILLPLSGPHQALGRQLWDAATLALFDSGRDDIVLLPRDTKGTPNGAAMATEAVLNGAADAVVGPLFSGSVAVATPILKTRAKRGIALSNNSAVAGGPVFLIGNEPEQQIDALASRLAAEGRRRVILFGPDTPYLRLIQTRLERLERAGEITLVDSLLYRPGISYNDVAARVRKITRYDERVGALKSFVEIFARAWQANEDPEEAEQSALRQIARRPSGDNLRHVATARTRVNEEVWPIEVDDYETAIAELLRIYRRELPLQKSPLEAMLKAVTEFERRETLGRPDYDAIFLPIGDEPLLVIAPMFEFFNGSRPTAVLVGTDIWEAAARNVPADLQGALYVTANSAAWEELKTRFATVYGYAPDPLISTIYDAVRVAITEKEETGRIALAEPFITRQAGFTGINGWFRFLPGGTNERTLTFVELRPDGVHTSAWTPQDRAPAMTVPATASPGKTGPVQVTAPPSPTRTAPISALEKSRISIEFRG